MVYFAVFLDLAQRARCAAAIFSRASGLKVRRAGVFLANPAGWKLVALLGEAFFATRPGLRPPGWPARSAFACWSRAISASIARIMSSVFMNPLDVRSTSGALPTPGYNRRSLFGGFSLAKPDRAPLRLPRYSGVLSEPPPWSAVADVRESIGEGCIKQAALASQVGAAGNLPGLRCGAL